MIGARILKAVFAGIGFMLVHGIFHYPDVVLLWDDIEPFSKEGAAFFLIVLLGMFLMTNVCDCKNKHDD